MGPIEICNRALGQVGARSQITNFAEASKEAVQCKLWYDTLREQLLRAVHWGFARAQAPMSMLGDLNTGTSPYPWPFKYTYPSDALRVRYVLPPGPPPQGLPPGSTSLPGSMGPVFNFAPSRANRFIIGNDLDAAKRQRKVLLSNVQSAQVVYTIDVEDVNLFDAQFQQALTDLLSSRIVIPLTGNKDIRSGMLQSAMDAVNAARVSDANESMPTTDHVPDWIAARGVPNAGLAFDFGLWFQPYEQLSWG